MKNRLFIALIFILLICFCVSCNDTKQPLSNSSYSEEAITKLRATVVKSDEKTVTVEIENGTIYTFPLDRDKVTSDYEEISSGQYAEISYYGGLDDFAEVQRVEITSIVITGVPISKRTEELLSEMTLEEKVGQMFLARCPESDGAKLAEEYKLGGYILFARDFKDKTKEQMISDIDGYQSCSQLGMFIAVDEEGGDVVRVSKYPAFRSEKFLSPQELYSKGGFELIESDTIEKALLLKSLGINLNLAPVCDVPRETSDYIYSRTMGTDCNLTAEYVKTVVKTMGMQKIGCSLKHFPGYGNNNDTHKGIAYDKRSYENFEECDFIPFKAGIDAGAGIVMVSHNIVYCMDEKNPASLSKNVHEIIRNELEFDGVIMTDDISMEGITDFTDDKDAAVKAVLAGNDMLCCTNFEVQVPAVIDAVNSGEISEEHINESVSRILKLKIELGII